MEMFHEEIESTIKACIYGLPGTGKTSFGVSAPKPFYVLSEKHAVPHIREAAKRMGVPVPPIFLATEADSLRTILYSLTRGDRSKPFELKSKDTVIYTGEWPETIVLDSLTDMARLLEEEINREAPPKIGKDGLPVTNERFWSTLGTRTQKLIKAFRDLPMNVLFLCLLDDRVVGEDENAERQVKPQLPMRSLSGFLAAAVNVVGITQRQLLEEKDADGQKKILYTVRTTGRNYEMTKPYRPLKDVEVPDFSDWIKRMTDSPVAVIDPSPEAQAANDKLKAEAKAETAKAKAKKEEIK